MYTRQLYTKFKGENNKWKWLIYFGYVSAMIFSILNTYLLLSNIYYHSFILILSVQIMIIATIVIVHSNLNQISARNLNNILKALQCNYKITNTYIAYTDYYIYNRKKHYFTQYIFYDDYTLNDMMIPNEILLEQLKGK